MKQQIENIIKENLPEKTDERKVATFGEWQAETYGEKMLVNAVLDQINPSKIADEVLKLVVEKILNSQGYVASIPEIDHGLGELLDSDVNFKQHPAGYIIFKNDIIKELSTLSPNKENK